ncbi:MAG: hypothetical protein ACKOOI_16385 [Pirellula sp.]
MIFRKKLPEVIPKLPGVDLVRANVKIAEASEPTTSDKPAANMNQGDSVISPIDCAHANGLIQAGAGS